MKLPARVAFSVTYRWYGIFGALGLLDHGCSCESDMVMAVDREEGPNAGGTPK